MRRTAENGGKGCDGVGIKDEIRWKIIKDNNNDRKVVVVGALNFRI